MRHNPYSQLRTIFNVIYCYHTISLVSSFVLASQVEVPDEFFFGFEIGEIVVLLLCFERTIKPVLIHK